ncbi:hypothetical protein MKW98_011107 [Papaver atlanticum]|uniref:Uncharacterized protein n=1 Tax=Papaver atlanticum TaxID=357466 RepID=A0AAD4XV38_9MAGN|nr:hypothetical protein MKW98_011107 [Papaver atlanticum]
MAFRKFSSDHGIISDLCKGNLVEKHLEFKVLALNGSYHGDTLGAMEAQAPSSYTGFLQQPWYRGRGVFLDPPTIFIRSSSWNLSLPKGLQSDKLKPENMSFSSRNELFCQERDVSDIGRSYSAYISGQLSQLSASGGSVHIGALILEPVIHAAGGMHMIDPLFQRILVNECQSRRIPVIFDEVFTGFWRLGIESAAKLLGDSKLMALLHGHSYSAHAMGCTAAVKAIQWFKDPLTNLNITSEGRQMRDLWDAELVRQISSHPGVKRVIMLGTLVALELEAQGSDVGYASTYAISLVRSLREDGIYMRPLGNVIYLMCGPCTSPLICIQLLNKLYRGLQEFNQSKTEKMQYCKP